MKYGKALRRELTRTLTKIVGRTRSAVLDSLPLGFGASQEALKVTFSCTASFLSSGVRSHTSVSPLEFFKEIILTVRIL